MKTKGEAGMTKIAIVSGSPVPESRLHGLTQYSQAMLESCGFEVDTIWVSELPAAELLRVNWDCPQIRQSLSLIEQAAAVILASPVYKAAYSGILKTYLDLLPQKGLSGKIVLPLFIGGTIAHLLSIDYALKPVVAALGGTHILPGVYAVDQWVKRLDGGGFELTAELKQRLDESLKQLTDELLLRKTSRDLESAPER